MEMPLIDVNKGQINLRNPRGGNILTKEKEKLYDEAISLKVTNNFVKEENKKLKTKLQMMENENQKKEKLIEDLLQMQQ